MATTFPRSMLFLMRPAVLAFLGILFLAPTLPASADPSAADMQKLSDWFARARARARKSVDQLPPDLSRWVPRPETSGLPNGIPYGRALTTADLDRIEIGYQAGILKIVSPDGHTVLFAKDRPGSAMRAVDSTAYAPLTNQHRRRIMWALGIRNGAVDDVSNGLMHEYRRLPGTKVAAVLGVLGSTSHTGGACVSSTVDRRIRSFLTSLLRTDIDVKVHRMAVLSLALCSEVDEATVNGVLDFMDTSDNSWETFTTQQFFEYHRDQIRCMSCADRVVKRLQASGNPYAPVIASNF